MNDDRNALSPCRLNFTKGYKTVYAFEKKYHGALSDER
jgi:hypothetical protein